MVSFSPTLRFCIHQLFIYGAFSGSLEQIETTFCTGKPTKKTNPSEKELASTTRQMEATTRVPAGGGVTFCTPAPASLNPSLPSAACAAVSALQMGKQDLEARLDVQTMSSSSKQNYQGNAL